MSLDSPDMPVYYADTLSDGARNARLPEQDVTASNEPIAPRRLSREYTREGNGTAEPSQAQSYRSASVRSNPPSSWRSDDRSPGKPNVVDMAQPKRHRPGSNAHFVEPAVPNTVKNGVEHYSRPHRDDGPFAQQTPYARDLSNAERGNAPRTSQDSHSLDEHLLTHEPKNPLNADNRSLPVRPGPFGRTFTQAFSVADPGPGAPTIDFRNMSRADKKEVIKLPWYQLMESSLKNHIVAALGELIGTTMFLFFAFAGTAVASVPAGTGGDIATPGDPGFSAEVQMYIALAFGFSLMVNVWVFYRISGGLFNPAVTLALLLVKVITPTRAAFVFLAQLAGGIAAAGLASAMFPTTLNVRTSLSAGTSVAQGVFIELVLTFELVFTIFMLAAEKHKARFIAPVGIGLALFIAELAGVYYTGGSLNPARSFGPCVVAADFNGEHWIYWVGPLAGSVCAVILYKVIKLLQYELVNPGQDSQD